ncbi:STAS/SEC14 domain-containing protein [Vibrio sp. CAIM 722]|uniref:STAS/SEC14 domain-containing protein n=1 Tax=Vibrio eleionomae TaxID=2653505 RepID=A0A7X4LPD4_9VIBR|nr:STAS/SEC14 domain-containing protein [Vibrio eleionomae]MZI95715.1 STAS/SEC14 domain-containing protein [Vibrio eleionomae]
MSYYKHGISIGLIRVRSEFLLSIKAVGTLTHDDYQRAAPMLEAATIKINQPKVKVLFDASEFAGWELRAAWDELKLGLEGGGAFDKVAVYANHDWQGWALKIGSWFLTNGEAQSFETYEQAVDWLLDDEPNV